MPLGTRTPDQQRPAPGAATPTATRTAILDAAEELFATHGFAATSIKQIGRRAKANTALLYYYYGDKVGLYRAVFARLGDALGGSASARLVAARSPDDVVGALVQAQVELMTQHPRAATLIVRELVDHHAEHAQPMILKLASGPFRSVIAKIEQGQAAGTFRPDLDAGFATVSTIAQMVYFMLAQPMVRLLLGKPASYPTPDDIRRFGRHAESFATAAVRPADHRPIKTRASKPHAKMRQRP